MGFFAALSSIVELVGMLKSLVVWIKDTFGDNPQKFIKDAGEAFAKLHGATTTEEKQNAARDLQDIFGRIN